jgi:exosortase D (VPLPA-CTERM-specific)
VPLIAAAMVLRDARLEARPIHPAWSGFALVIAGCVLGLLAHVSPFVFPADFGLLLVVVGLLAAGFGWAWTRGVWPGLAYLLFALPLPGLLFTQLSAGLQLLSSGIGVAIIHALGIAAFRDGNIIDLGTFQLQVAEACSGLRYLFPLASFAFLAAYFFRAPAWQRVLLFLSAVPITIAMNSLRIALTGVLADAFGLEAAQGFIHDFEGWAVFCACIAALLLEMQLLCLLPPKGGSLLQRLELTWPARASRPHGNAAAADPARRRRGPLVAILGVAMLALVLSRLAVGEPGMAPARDTFAAFPQNLGAFQGRALPVEPGTIQALGLTDSLSMAFDAGDPAAVPAATAAAPEVYLWIAYYDSQRAGDATHSPRFCIPGAGWTIDRLDQVEIPVPDGASSRLIPVNRAMISKGNVRQLVYYWFQERGRSEAAEYRVKLDILRDGLIRNRTDGALVRLITPLAGPAGGPVAGPGIGDVTADSVGGADDRLKAFAAALYPALPRFVPE